MTQPPEPEGYDENLSRRLSGLADDAAAYTTSYAQSLPAESVRRLGTQRRHRRFGGIAVAGLACVIMAGGVAIGATRLDGSQTPPVASPSSTTAAPSTSASDDPTTAPPSSSTPDPQPTRPQSTSGSPATKLDTDLLPITGEIGWQDPGDFDVARTSQGQGELPQQACVQALSGLGAQAIGRRDFAITGQPTTRATAWVLQLDTAAAAAKATTTLRAWGAACSTDQPRQVTVGHGTAEFYETTVPASGDLATFVSYGFTTVGDRIGIVVMTDLSTEAHWSYTLDDSTGLPLHPLIRSLPLVAARLAGTPGTVPRPPAATACRGGQDGLLVSVSVVKGSAAAGSVSYRISVINTTKVACTLQGFPGVQFADDSGKKIGADATRTGSTGPTIRLEPQKTTTSIIRLSQAGAYGAACDQQDVSSFRIFLPGMTEPSYAYSPDMKACANTTINQLTVTAFGTE